MSRNRTGTRAGRKWLSETYRKQKESGSYRVRTSTTPKVCVVCGTKYFGTKKHCGKEECINTYLKRGGTPPSEPPTE